MLVWAITEKLILLGDYYYTVLARKQKGLRMHKIALYIFLN